MFTVFATQFAYQYLSGHVVLSSGRAVDTSYCPQLAISSARHRPELGKSIERMGLGSNEDLRRVSLSIAFSARVL